MGRNGTKGPPLQNRTETLRVIEIVYRLLPRYTTRPRVLFSELR